MARAQVRGQWLVLEHAPLRRMTGYTEVITGSRFCSGRDVPPLLRVQTRRVPPLDSTRTCSAPSLGTCTTVNIPGFFFTVLFIYFLLRLRFYFLLLLIVDNAAALF